MRYAFCVSMTPYHANPDDDPRVCAPVTECLGCDAAIETATAHAQAGMCGACWHDYLVELERHRLEDTLAEARASEDASIRALVMPSQVCELCAERAEPPVRLWGVTGFVCRRCAAEAEEAKR